MSDYKTQADYLKETGESEEENSYPSVSSVSEMEVDLWIGIS